MKTERNLPIKRIVLCLQLVAAGLALAPPARANWGSFISTGTTTGIGTPSCAALSPGEVVCGVRTAAASPPSW
jgi:hypothetical protein